MANHRAQAKAFLRAYGRAVRFMHTNKEDFKKIITRYSGIKDPGMLDGSVQYAYDFVEKIPLVNAMLSRSLLTRSSISDLRQNKPSLSSSMTIVSCRS
jgi:hypothetical protein